MILKMYSGFSTNSYKGKLHVINVIPQNSSWFKTGIDVWKGIPLGQIL